MFSDLSTLTPLQKVAAADTQFNQLFNLAKSGDAESGQELARFASTYLRLARDTFASGAEFTSRFVDVNSKLSQVAGLFGSSISPGSANLTSVTPELALLLSRQVELQAQLALIEEKDLAGQLAEALGDLALAKDESIFEIANRFDISIEELANKLGVDLSIIDGTFISSIGALALQLSTDSLSLLQGLDFSLARVAATFGVDINTLNGTLVSSLALMSSGLNVGIQDLVRALGLSNTDLAAAFGLNLSRLDANLLDGINALAAVLHTDNQTVARLLDINLQELNQIVSQPTVIVEPIVVTVDGADIFTDEFIRNLLDNLNIGHIGLFARGGIANKPSIFGEAGLEAAVPIPGGFIPALILNPPGPVDVSGMESELKAVNRRLDRLLDENKQLRADNQVIANRAAGQRDSAQEAIETGNEDLVTEIRGNIATGDIL